MLRVEDLHVQRKGRIALAGVSIEVGEREAVAIVGPNGAGKSTLLRAISGLEEVASGRVTFAGVDIGGMPPHIVVSHGVVQVPEGRQLFPELTVQQNLWLGGFAKPRAQRDRSTERMFDLFPRLAERRTQLAGSLSGGEQQILAIGRALASEPKILLLDEPSVGLSPVMIGTVWDVVRSIQASGIAILLVEQNIALARDLTSRAYALVTGQVVLSGASADVLTEEHAGSAYLGAGAAESGTEGGRA